MVLLRYYLPILLLLSISHEATAARKTQYISLQFAASLNEDVRYNKLRLIDRRRDTSTFGIFKGLYNYFDLTTQRPFAEELASLDSGMFGLSVRDEGELLVVLYDHLYKETRDHIATLTLHADFFLRKPSEPGYRYVFTVDSFYEAYHSKSLPDGLFSQAWRRCLTTAVRENAEVSDTRLYTAAEAAFRQDSARLRYPVYQTTTYPVGVYYSWEEFLQLKPGTRELRVRCVENNVLKPYAFYIPDSTQRRGSRELDEKDFFAAFDGSQWYKTSDKRIYAMQREEDGNFYYPGVQTGIITGSAKSGHLAAAFAAGGLIGVAVVVVVMDQVDKKNDYRSNVLYRLRLNPDGRGVPVLRKD